MPSTPPASPPARPPARPWRPWPAAAGAFAALFAGCTAGTDGAAPGHLPSLVLTVVLVALLIAVPLALLAFQFGRQRGLTRQAAALREARTAERHHERLRTDWRWRSDAAHRLVLWQAPGAAAGGPLPGLPAALAARLAAEQPFRALELPLEATVDGHRLWRLAGEPLSDDEGRFCGFEGRATPLDETATLAREAAAFTAAVDALPGPALLLAREADQADQAGNAADGGWVVRRHNPAAARRWPAHAPGTRFRPRPDELPPALADWLRASPALAASPPPRLDGWGLAPLAGTPPALLLWQVAAPEAEAAASDSDNFSFTLSHDLRAPIRVVEGFTRIVKEDYGAQLDRVGNDHLERVLGAAARMNLMIDALLNLARLSQQPLARQRVDLSQLAGYVVDELRRGSPERQVEVEIQPGLATTGDPTLLRLVLENLIGNAWKYTGRCDPAKVSLTRVQHGSSQAYCVADNGAGFDPRSAERLFGLFQRLHSASEFPGHGVGLASVRRIVRRHGGEIWAEAEPGRGAAFYFTLES